MKSKCVFMCDGCDKVRGWNATGWVCSIYREPWNTIWGRHGKKCPFNGGIVTQERLDGKIRVGQQRNRRVR